MIRGRFLVKICFTRATSVAFRYLPRRQLITHFYNSLTQKTTKKPNIRETFFFCFVNYAGDEDTRAKHDLITVDSSILILFSVQVCVCVCVCVSVKGGGVE